MLNFTKLRTLGPTVKSRLIALSNFLATLVGLVLVYSIVFQLVMTYEGRDYSWLSGLYWTLVTMSTLGFGDIVFSSDVGRIFSIVVLLSGIVFMLVLLPFMFIEFVYAPWAAAQSANRVPRRVPGDMAGHVILTFSGPVARALIGRLKQFNYPYVVVLAVEQEVLALRDEGIEAICGELDAPETYNRARVEAAAMVGTTRPDIENTTVVFTARGVAPDIPIFATAREPAAADILKLAGCTREPVINTSLVAEGADTNRGAMIEAMIGRAMDDVHRPATPAHEIGSESALAWRGAASGAAFEDVSLDVRPGEVVALFGKLGSGAAEVGETAFGIRELDAGSFEAIGKVVTLKGPTQAIDAGVGFLPADRKAGGAGFTDPRDGRVIVPHGLRSTFRDWAAEEGYERDMAELALGHEVGSAVERAYRRTDMAERRRVMMAAWAAHVTGDRGKAGSTAGRPGRPGRGSAGSGAITW